MKIKLYWPECDLVYKGNYFKGVDAFWVECSPKDVEQEVFPYLSQAQIEESKKYWEQAKEDRPNKDYDTERFCFLVSRDQKSIVPFPWYYPYSGLWNAYCPFKKISEIKVNEFSEIWDKVQSIDSAYDKIKEIKASVGSFFGGNYDVDIDLMTRKVTWKKSGRGGEEKIHKIIRSTTAKRFIEELKIANLLDWKGEYIESDICDGTQWHVEIIRVGRSIKKVGDNKFPDEWDFFCKSIARITGKQFR